MSEDSERRLARALFAVAVCTSLLAAGPAAATTPATEAGDGVRAATAADAPTVAQPETADEFLAALRELNGSEAYEQYGEFEVIRVRAVADVQVGEFSAADRERTALVLSTLRTFDAAYELVENGSRDASLVRANETAGLIGELRDAGGTESATLATLALDRFYRDLGERFNAEAEATARTPDRVALLEQSARAFREAGAVERYTSLTVRADEQRANYTADAETINATLSATAEFQSACDGACASPTAAIGAFGPGVFGQYRQARTLTARLDEAASLADRHGLADRAETIDAEYASPTAAARAGLTMASAIVALLYAVVVGAVAGVVATRLVKWERDVTASRVGEIVSAGGGMR